MRHTKRYIIFALVLMAVLLAKLNTWSDEYGEIRSFRGARLEKKVFYPLIATNINATSGIQLMVDEKASNRLGRELVLDKNMQVEVPLSFIREFFQCSAYADKTGQVIIQRNQTCYRFNVGEKKGSADDSTIMLSAAPQKTKESYQLPLSDLCTLWGYSYSYDTEKYLVQIKTDTAEVSKLPVKYNLRDENRTSAIKNQGSQATCWAYAAAGALESSLYPSDQTSFSAKAIVKNNAYGNNEKEGGDYRMAVSYFLSWQGPQPTVKRPAVRHVQEVHFYSQDDIDAIKWAIIQNGGVSTSLYADVGTSSLLASSYYNKKTNAYYYNGSKEPNHDVIIIGWDDNYAARNFHNEVPGKGAFICQNSWGKEFGDKGTFYVSYYDTNVGDQSVSYVKTESTDNYDTIFQSDLCGQIGTIGYKKDTIYAANIFEAKQAEEMDAAGFYAMGKNTSYKIYLVQDYNGTQTIFNKKKVAEGTVTERGYYTIPFDKKLAVQKGKRFAVVIEIRTPDSERPMAIEYRADATTKNVDIQDGIGYVSRNGVEWESVENGYKANLCLKAYGKNLQEE